MPSAIGIELIAQADVEDPRNDRINAVLGMPVRHQLHAMGHFDPDRVCSGLQGVANQNGQARLRRERGERLPLNVFRQDGSERRLARLMGTYWFFRDLLLASRLF